MCKFRMHWCFLPDINWNVNLKNVQVVNNLSENVQDKLFEIWTKKLMFKISKISDSKKWKANKFTKLKKMLFLNLPVVVFYNFDRLISFSLT